MKKDDWSDTGSSSGTYTASNLLLPLSWGYGTKNIFCRIQKALLTVALEQTILVFREEISIHVLTKLIESINIYIYLAKTKRASPDGSGKDSVFRHISGGASVLGNNRKKTSFNTSNSLFSQEKVFFFHFQLDFSGKRGIFYESNISGRSSVWLER